jgi:hypothetical protein
VDRFRFRKKRKPNSLFQLVPTVAAIRSPSGIQRYTRLAAHVHSAGEEMHDGIAAAEDRDSYADI